jgi:formylglycine-generating enzyme required for sulfatase activity
MSGNVWEWVQDAYCPYPDGSVTDPKGECESPHRVIRGGSWLFDSGSARCGLRYTHVRRTRATASASGWRVTLPESATCYSGRQVESHADASLTASSSIL